MPRRRWAWWQRFETFRNRLPLIDHSLVADSEATDLAGECSSFSNLTRFLMRSSQLSPSEAASRVRAAAAVGPRMSMLGECLEPLLPNLAALQRKGAVTIEKVQIVERAMNKLSRPGLNPDDVETPENHLRRIRTGSGANQIPHGFALQVVDAADPDGPEPVDDQLQQDRRYLDLRQHRDGMWHLQGKLTTARSVPRSNTILDPLARHRTSQHRRTKTETPLRSPMNGLPASGLHDALDEACGRLLKSNDQPMVGGVPASVIVTVQLEDLLAKAGLAETNDGSMLSF